MKNPESRARTQRFFNAMLDSGVIMAAPGFFVLSTANTEEEIDYLLEVALEALRKI
ncbi:hypothetical protein D3C83_271600 [compost metagenome]